MQKITAPWKCLPSTNLRFLQWLQLYHYRWQFTHPNCALWVDAVFTTSTKKGKNRQKISKKAQLSPLDIVSGSDVCTEPSTVSMELVLSLSLIENDSTKRLGQHIHIVIGLQNNYNSLLLSNPKQIIFATSTGFSLEEEKTEKEKRIDWTGFQIPHLCFSSPRHGW